ARPRTGSCGSSSCSSTTRSDVGAPMKILVCGAGVAGLASTIYLKRDGHDVTTIERSPHLRVAGGPVDIRGDSIDFVAELGLWDEMTTHEVHMTDDLYFVDAEGKK